MTDRENREKVIKGFECCHVMVHDLGPDKTSCGICPYKDVQTKEQIDLGGIECIAVLHDDALALLKEQERKKGSWDYGTQCSVCKGTIIPPKDRKIRVNFCPWCGADMRDSYE